MPNIIGGPDNSTISEINGLVGVETGGIGTTQLAAAGVTLPKLAAANIVTSLSSGSFVVTGGVFVDVTNLSVTITTSGRPVLLALIGDGTAVSSYVGVTSGSSTVAQGYWQFLRGVTVITSGTFFTGVTAASSEMAIPPGAFTHIDTPVAGTYTYVMQVEPTTGAMTIEVEKIKLVAYEF